MDCPKCPCKPCFSEYIPINCVESTSQEVSLFNHRTSTITFETTVVGKTARKIFRIQNDSKETQVYLLQRDPNTNPIYHVFDCKLAKTSVASGDYLEFIITYKPQVSNEKNVDYFQIAGNDLKVNKICLQGECIGPSINISIKKLYFYNTKYGQQLINTFEIRNTSNVSAVFQFDYNKEKEDQEIFKLDKTCGTIESFNHTYITVKFDVDKIGIYSQHLICLIMNHPPIMVELLGAQATNLNFNIAEVELKRFSQKTDEIEGYSGYMYDSVKMTTKKPPFSLSVNYLDFGRVEFQKKANNSCTLVTSLTNHLADQEIKVVWINSNSTVFSITPEEIIIPPGESVLYECQFRPDLSDQLYSKTLKACVYWIDIRETMKEISSLEFVEILTVPLSITLKVLGHSFPENKGWLPLVEIIPEVVILPPCMPMSPSYTTFMLRSSGHLPTSFKFVPPTKTNFLLKPMIGIIHDFQIVVAQLQPDLNDKKAYIERWTLELNGRIDDCLALYLKGYSESASITVGINNVVAFNTVYPNCQDISNVAIKNTSIHFLKYNFILDNNNDINIDHPQGQLASNEIIFLQWYFTGHLKLPEVSVIQCEVQTVQNMKQVTGAPTDTFVTVYTKCEYSELCATPNNHDFGELLWGTMHSTELCLFNFGESPIHFKLLPKNSLTELAHLNIVPTRGTIKPREKMKIIVHINVTKTGLQEIGIMYQVRLHAMSNIVIDDGKGYDIFFIHCLCVYPTLQIEDIAGNNFGFLFSKIALWEMFKIDEINHILREIQHDEVKTIEISVPDYEMGEADFFATLVFRNVTQFNAEMKLKRKKLCGCQPVIKAKGLSFREKVHACIHRDMLKMTLSHESVEAKDMQILKMDVKYLEYGLTQMMYIIALSNNRKVNLLVNINVLPTKVTLASKYALDYELQLKSIFIGEKEPPAQVFPLYNNSTFPINYEVDVTPLACLNFSFDFDIFKCINPKGTVLPFSSKEILFSFIPIEVRKYTVVVPLKMEENEVLLKICGEGVLKYDSHTSGIVSTMPSSSKGLYMENPIELSTDYLVIEPFPVWSTVEKLLFIRNQTADRIIGYSWQDCIVEGTVQAQVVYQKCILQPKEHQAIIVRINSFDQPCCLRLQMACKLLDHTQHIRHKESTVAYNLKQEELEGQFTITEEGIFYPKNEVVILPKPENFFVTLAIDLCITSIPDTDLCMNKEKQLEQSPQYSLRLNMDDIFKEYAKSLIPKKSELNLQILKELDKTADQKNPKTQKQCCKVNFDKNNIKMFKQVVECLIADTVLTDLFCKVVETTSSSSKPYYTQFNMDEDDNLHCTTLEDINEKTLKCLEKRMALVEDFLNKPQAPFLANVLKELIAEGIHEVFHLGPQIKNQSHKPYIYYSAKSKFTCPSCKCNL